MYVRYIKVRTIMKSLKAGNTRFNACKAAGITTVTLFYWCKKFPRLKMIIDAAVNDRINMVEDAQYQAAIGGNPTAQIFFLCNRAPERWKRDALVNNTILNKVESNNNTNVYAEASNEELRGIIALAKRVDH